MKKLTLLVCAALVMTLSSCAAIEGIFKAGFAVGIIVVVVIIAVLLWIISLFRRKS